MAFSKQYESKSRVFSLFITITCPGKKRFRAWAEEAGKQNSKYVDRLVAVDGKMTIHFNFPFSPDLLFIGIINAENPQDKDFEITMMEAPLKKYNIYMEESTKRFVNMAAHFSSVCGYAQASPKGRVFKNNTDGFEIKFFDVIRDNKTGAVLNTPARVGHETGHIQIAKSKFDAYTIPMRMIILLHEYSHKYKNPKIGVQISNEFGADINALYIYLGLGFSKIDAITVFSKVFLRAQTDGNMERMRLIYDYIKRFEAGEFAQVT